MPISNYVNPLSGVKYTTGRTDQGVDFEAGAKGVGKPIAAMGKAKVLFVSRSYQGYGQYVSYQLLDGPYAGRAIFVGHSKVADVKKGQILNAGDTVAYVQGYDALPGHIEIGWADPNNPGNTLARSTGTAGHNPTPEGDDFHSFFAQNESQQSSTDLSRTDVPPGSTADPGPFFDTSPVHPSDIQQASVSAGGPGATDTQLADLWDQIANQQFASPDTRLFQQNSKAMLP